MNHNIVLWVKRFGRVMGILLGGYFGNAPFMGHTFAPCG